MTQLGPFLALLGVAAVALAAVGAALGWYGAESRRVRRGLRKVLKAEPHAMIVAHGRGRGAGFNFAAGLVAVAWDAGAWCLVYRIDELLGAELIVDGLVAGRTFRGEPRRPLDILGGAEKQVNLRLVFDDPQHPDFLLELWSDTRAARPPALDAEGAVAEGNRWLARLESLFRRKPAPGVTRAPRPEPPERPAPEPAAAPPPAAQAPAAPSPAGARQELPFEEAPPWDEDDGEADEQARL